MCVLGETRLNTQINNNRKQLPVVSHNDCRIWDFRCTLQHCTNKYICLLISSRWNCGKCKPGCGLWRDDVSIEMKDVRWEFIGRHKIQSVRLSSISPLSRFALISPESAVAVLFENNIYSRIALFQRHSIHTNQFSSTFIAMSIVYCCSMKLCRRNWYLFSFRKTSVGLFCNASSCSPPNYSTFVRDKHQSVSQLIHLPIDRMNSIFSLNRCVRPEWLTSLIKFELIFIRNSSFKLSGHRSSHDDVAKQSNEYAWSPT